MASNWLEAVSPDNQQSLLTNIGFDMGVIIRPGPLTLTPILPVSMITHTHTHTHIYIYIYVCVCVCVGGGGGGAFGLTFIRQWCT